MSVGDQLMLASIVEDDGVLSAAWSTGNIRLFVARFVALKRGCGEPGMAARCRILELGPDLRAFANAAMKGDP